MSEEFEFDDNGPRVPDERRAKEAVARFRPTNNLLTRGVIQGVVLLSQWVMTRRNRLVLEGGERLRAHYDRGSRGKAEAGHPRGLLTFSNHVSILDDPLIVSNFGLGSYESVRWVAADAFNFFGDPLRGAFFGAGKCVPVVRGWGESQPGMDFLRERLRAGDWVHLFPEGGRTRDPQARLRMPFKSGIGRLLDETRPLALPYYHHGMAGVLPIHGRFFGSGQTVTVRFGDGVPISDAFVEELAPGQSGRERWDALTRWTERTLTALQHEVRPELDGMPPAPSQ